MLTNGQFVTATATDSGNNTSEFSQCVPVNGSGVVTTLTLDPIADTNPVGTTHVITATVEDALSAPVGGVNVIFMVSGANSASGACTTGTNGQCTFSYPGPNAGTDVITAFADSNGNSSADLLEPFATATKMWTPPTSIPGFVTGGGQILDTVSSHLVTFGFNARSS